MKKNNVIKLDGRGVCIIDGDIDLFRIAAVHQKHSTPILGMEDEGPIGMKSLAVMVKELEDIFTYYAEQTHCGSYVVMLSGSTANNFRKKLLPTYKGNRKKSVRPPQIGPLRDALLTHPSMAVRQRDNLEGDDLCGIFSTAQRGKGRRTVVVTLDKDMRTLPGNHYNPAKPDEGIFKVTPKEAALYHMTQTLTGDPTDHYKGCRGIGPKKAFKLLEGCSGRSVEDYYRSLWKVVVDTYESRGYTKADALVQARCARILQSTDWNPKTKRINLWTCP